MISLLEFKDDLQLLDNIRLAYKNAEGGILNIRLWFATNTVTDEPNRKYILEFLWQEGYVVDNNQMEHTIVKQKLLHLDSFIAEYARVVERMKAEQDDKERERRLKKWQLRSSKISLPVSILALTLSGITAYHTLNKSSYEDKQNEIFQKLQGLWERKTGDYGLYVTGKTITIITLTDSLVEFTEEYAFILEDSVLRIHNDSLILTAEIRKLDEKELSLVLFNGKIRGQGSEEALNIDGKYVKRGKLFQ